MPEYLAPGVYIEERPGQRTIEGVSTSTAAFVGVTERGPIVGPPRLVTSFGDFQRSFGDFVTIRANQAGEHGHLPLAVKQFFDNGGKRAFIVRAFNPAATPAHDFRELPIRAGVVARLRATAPVGSNRALLTTYRGLSGGDQLQRDGNAGAPTVVINSVEYATGTATLAGNLPEDFRGDTAFGVLHPISTPVATALLIAREPGVWAERVRVQFRPVDRTPVNATAAPTAVGTDFDITVTSAASFYRGCTIRIMDLPAAGDVQNQAYATVLQITGNTLRVRPDAAGFAAGAYVPVPANPGPGNQVLVSVAEVEVLVLYGSFLERFTGSWRYFDPDPASALPPGWTRAEVDAFNFQRSVWFDLHRRSTLVRLNGPIGQAAPITAVIPYNPANPLDSHPTTNDGAPAPLAPSAASGFAVGRPDDIPDFADYTGNIGAGAGARSGIAALHDEESISLVAIPGITDARIQSALVTHATTMRYRFAVLDGPRDADIAAIRTHRGFFDTPHAALYYPWVEIVNPVDGEDMLVPPSGSVLGVYARSDTERGVHKAPANEVIANAMDLPVPVTMGDQEILNPEGINAIRDFRQQRRGIRIWGARTVSSDPQWKYVNVRRLFNFIEHSIDRGTQWVVFEPNNQDLWGRVRRTIEVFLEAQWRTGALFGAKPEDSFYVKCDRSTMSVDDLTNGRLVVEIGIVPTRPAEFVIFRISQLTADARAN